MLNEGQFTQLRSQYMPKSAIQLAKEPTDSAVGHSESSKAAPTSSLAALVSEHLCAKGLRQIDFCRHTGFDQGLLSKILSSVVTTLNVETALKLAAGLNLQPAEVFDVIGKRDVHEMLIKLYSPNGNEPVM
jgi:hypothetical protein